MVVARLSPSPWRQSPFTNWRNSLKANIWREKAKHRAAVVAQMLTLPSGMEVKVRRPSIEGLMIAGRLPEYVTREFLSAKVKKRTLAEIAEKVEDDGIDGTAAIQYMRFLVCETCVEPRVVLEGAAEDDDETVNVTELPAHDLAYLFKFATNELPEALVASVEGGSTVGAVRSFREGAEGPAAAPGSGDGTEVLSEAVGAAGNTG